MRKITLVTALFLSLINTAQNSNIQRTCGTPSIPQKFENWVQSLSNTITPSKYGHASTQSVFNIPVIVHVIHNNESVNTLSATSGNNLNAAQIIDQINILNKDYNGLNADTSLIPSVFKPLLGKFQVNFCLAVVNPTGGILAEPGIDRINRISKGWSAPPYSINYIDGSIKPNSIWDPNKYFNIWVCPITNGILGYATIPNPGSSGLSGLSSPFGTATTDGVGILNTSFGSIGTAASGQYNKGRTTTHEVGHWFGLRHIWGDSNCGTDYCNDTPPAQTSNFGCPSFPYHLGTCSGNTTGEMTMNYMDYTDDACMYMFTADQKTRAQLIMTNSTMRAALLTSTVCNLPTTTDDIGITFVSNPTYTQVTSCTNTLQPILKMLNYGSNTITSAFFTYNIDGVNTQTMAWSGSAGPNTSFMVTLPTITGITLGAHVFNVNVSSPNGNIDANPSNNNSTQQFVITSNLNLTVPSVSTCVGGSATLYASGGVTYTWNTGASTSFLTVSPLVTSIYTVTATNGACSAQKTATVTIQSLPTFTLNKNEVCMGVPTIITASGANTYTWNTNQTGSNITLTLTAADTVTLTGSLGGACVNTLTYNISVNPNPTNTLSPSNLSCGSCNDASISAITSGGSAPYTYVWTPGNIGGPLITNLEAGCYTVQVTDAKGCKSTDEACVSFDTGIFDSSSQTDFITISPNPTRDEFRMDFKIVEPKTIFVYDALGKIIVQKETREVFLNIDLRNYATGVYFIKVYTENKLFIGKIIKHE